MTPAPLTEVRLPGISSTERARQLSLPRASWPRLIEPMGARTVPAWITVSAPRLSEPNTDSGGAADFVPGWRRISRRRPVS